MKEIEPFEGKLSLKQIAEGFNLCTENAEQLLADTELLLDNMSYAHAFALVVLAVEEMGKCPMLATAATLESEDTEGWKKFWKRFRQHKTKQRDIIMLDYFFCPSVTTKNTLWEIEFPLERYKHLAIYVDNIGGEFVSPTSPALTSSIFSKNFVEGELELARKRLRFMKKMHGKVTETILKKLRKRLKGVDKKDLKAYISRLQEDINTFLEEYNSTTEALDHAK